MPVSIQVRGAGVSQELGQWVDTGLMTLFNLGEAASACESAAADFSTYLDAYRKHSPLRSEEYELIPVYRELAMAWRLRVASWYALRQDPGGSWRDEVYRLLDAVGGGSLRRRPGW